MEISNLYSIFEHEFGRILTPMEREFIEEWKKNGIDENTIIQGLKESVFNDVRNFKYIDKILQSWNSEKESLNNIELNDDWYK